ncbi:endonuclease/exonuclease/phosphatase family protein [Pseudomonas sp. LFM046]|uniref:endonuclease/exonuclease/phosphatase family protein n=1 Tax=Pseudomonas sp. LFM046 TaxID=1608357 RepID=UPI0005CFD954|nr:endonuclease/exonuclease/phosphatase family protein [Pseudomonas sp. LFM046]
MRIASFNLEKNGKSSTLNKRTQVDEFIAYCNQIEVDLIFLCEVHSAQEDNYEDNLGAIYRNYNVECHHGGYSNSYIVMTRKSANLTVTSQGNLKNLNRDLIAVEAKGVNNYSGYVFLAHFKSGQNGQTKSQLNACTSLGGNWVVTGDLNLDISRVGELETAGVAYDCWKGLPTHHSGGILDWVLASAFVRIEAVDLTGHANFFDMSGPDHRPIIFDAYAN